jgi:FKBP-type peptidyl-prolyl cis-trans isomerase FkpA
MRAWTILAMLVLGALLSGCGDKSEGVTDLAITDLVTGTGTTALAGSVVKVDYTGWLYDEKQADKKGTQFDTSIGGQPLQFQLGAGQVIAGFERGVLGMRVGGQRRLYIPPTLAYGSTGTGPIPPNATLVFEVTLRAVEA